jgi:hypothetical protein
LVPIDPEAPGWLTTTIVWPSTFSSSAAVTRVIWSVEPPAAHGTIRLIGRVGFQFWASAPLLATARIAARATRRLGRRLVIVVS